jgi:hypothetical protein
LTTPGSTPSDRGRSTDRSGPRDIREEADREIDAYAGDREILLLLPEDRWEEFLRLTGVDQAGEDAAVYRGVRFKRAAVTAVIAQDGF